MCSLIKVCMPSLNSLPPLPVFFLSLTAPVWGWRFFRAFLTNDSSTRRVCKNIVMHTATSPRWYVTVNLYSEKHFHVSVHSLCYEQYAICNKLSLFLRIAHLPIRVEEDLALLFCKFWITLHFTTIRTWQFNFFPWSSLFWYFTYPFSWWITLTSWLSSFTKVISLSFGFLFFFHDFLQFLKHQNHPLLYWLLWAVC